MSGRRLVVLRHGRTAWNAEGRAQGHEDVGLDDLGFEQAEAAAVALARFEPTVLVSSDLARARQTAAMLEKQTGLTAREDARLREYDTGARTGLTREEYVARTGEDHHWDGHHLVEVPGAEPVDAVAARMGPALSDALALVGDDETGVVVTHGAALRVGVAVLLGLPPAAYDALGAMSNCGWVELREHGAARLRLAAYDATAAV